MTAVYTDTLGDRLAALPTLITGHTDDLKLETDRVRVWLSRLTPEDGLDPADAVTIETRTLGRGGWLGIARLPADTPDSNMDLYLALRVHLPADVAGILADLITGLARA